MLITALNRDRPLRTFAVVASLLFGLHAQGRTPGSDSDGQSPASLLKLVENANVNSKGTATFPLVFCWYKGLPALYIQTDASDPAIALQMGVNRSAPIANSINAPLPAVDDIYAVTNFKQGNIIPSAPIPAGPYNTDPNYSPIWQLSTVTWNSGTTPHILKSEEEVLAAKASGLVIITKTGIAVNCPVIYTPAGGKLPTVTIHIDNHEWSPDSQ